MKKKLFDDPGLVVWTTLSAKKWLAIVSHTEEEIKGFFGKYRFLSNFWPAKVVLDGQEYSTTENAYQAAKFPEALRKPFYNCHPKDAIIFAEDLPGKIPLEEWNGRKLQVMEGLLVQKFDPTRNSDNHQRLLETGDKYLEETNYWEDVFWGVHKTSRDEAGVGENNLGKLLMKIRVSLRK